MLGSIFLLTLYEVGQRSAKNLSPKVSNPAKIQKLASNVQLISFNVFTDNQDKEKTADWILRRIDPKQKNIVFLMEVNDSWVQKLDQKLQGKLPFALRVPRPDNFGAALYTDFPFKGEIINLDKMTQVPAIFAEFHIQNTLIRFFGVHPVPPISKQYFESRNLYFTELKKLARESASPTICAGDFNSSPWSPHFKNLMERETNDLRDGSYYLESFGGLTRPGTWGAFGGLLSLPIDTVLYTPHFVLKNAEVGPSLGSDHKPVIVSFE